MAMLKSKALRQLLLSSREPLSRSRLSLSKLTTMENDNCSFKLFHIRHFAAKPKPSSSPNYKELNEGENNVSGFEDDVISSSGISRPLSHILKELNKKVPDPLLKLRMEHGISIKYIPWHIVNRIMNLHAPEWSGEVRSITYSADGKSVSVAYRVTLYGTDAEIFRESTGTASVSDTGYGDPVQKAEGMAFRRACARFGLGLHLYHEDLE